MTTPHDFAHAREQARITAQRMYQNARARLVESTGEDTVSYFEYTLLSVISELQSPLWGPNYIHPTLPTEPPNTCFPDCPAGGSHGSGNTEDCTCLV